MSFSPSHVFARATTVLKLPYYSDKYFGTSEEVNTGEGKYSDSSDENYYNIAFRLVLQNGNLQTLVLDETDRLLELGFRKDIQDILSYIDDDSALFFDSSNPPRTVPDRQTLLFSATLSPSIMNVVDLAISKANSSRINSTSSEKNRNYEVVDCIQENDSATHTNTNTRQSYIVLPPKRFWTGTIEYILQLMAQTSSSRKKNKHKIIIFFEMTRLVQLYSKFFSLRLGHTLGVWELHGKMDQRERTKVARRFQNASHGVLMTSDVSARGIDYPDVTHVIQVGAPQNKETYIHRLGRTGRAGKEGKGTLILPEHEKNFVKDELDGLKLIYDESLEQSLRRKRAPKKSIMQRSIRKNLASELGLLKDDLKSGRDTTGIAESLTLAYQSLVSYYFQTRRQSRNVDEDQTIAKSSLNDTVAILNQLIDDFGLPELPPIGFQRAKSMGIEHLAGQLNIRKDWNDQNWDVGTIEKKNHVAFDDWFGLVDTSEAKGPSS